MKIMSIMGTQARISSPDMLEAARIFAVLGRLGRCCPTLIAISVSTFDGYCRPWITRTASRDIYPSSRSRQAIRCISKASLWRLATGESTE